MCLCVCAVSGLNVATCDQIERIREMNTIKNMNDEVDFNLENKWTDELKVIESWSVK